MPDLFGLDIAGIINTEIANAGGVRSGTLTKETPGTRTPGDLAGGTNPTSVAYTFNGFVEQKATAGDLTQMSMAVVTILGASVTPTAVPEVNDRVLIDGITWELVELLSRDPAAAVYEFRAER